MKNRLIVLLLILFVSFGGCKQSSEKSDKKDFSLSLDSAPVALVSVKDLPEWLQDRIYALEEEFCNASSPIYEEARVYQGKLENRSVYFVRNPYNNCIICDIFHENGERAVSACDIFSAVKNWVIIWQCGANGIKSDT